MTQHEKEVATVTRVCIEDMRLFPALPFVWDSPIQKETRPSTKPYAYMDISETNVPTACDTLLQMNALLWNIHALSELLPHELQIPIGETLFTPQAGQAYSKIICTPHTLTGRRSKYPASLLFMTPLQLDTDATHGELFYGQTGNVEKGRICFWRSRTGYFIHLQTISSTLTISKIETTAVLDDRRLPATIYRYP